MTKRKVKTPEVREVLGTGSMPDFTDRDYRKKRILQITCQIVESRAAAGEVNPDDPEDLKRAVKAAAKDAKAAYDAAVEFMSG